VGSKRQTIQVGSTFVRHSFACRRSHSWFCTAVARIRGSWGAWGAIGHSDASTGYPCAAKPPANSSLGSALSTKSAKRLGWPGARTASPALEGGRSLQWGEPYRKNKKLVNNASFMPSCSHGMETNLRGGNRGRHSNGNSPNSTEGFYHPNRSLGGASGRR